MNNKQVSLNVRCEEPYGSYEDWDDFLKSPEANEMIEEKALSVPIPPKPPQVSTSPATPATPANSPSHEPPDDDFERGLQDNRDDINALYDYRPRTPTLISEKQLTLIYWLTKEKYLFKDDFRKPTFHRKRQLTSFEADKLIRMGKERQKDLTDHINDNPDIW